MTLERTLLDLEQDGWRALSGGDPVSFYDDILTEDAVMILPAPVGTLTREQAVESLDVIPWSRFDISEPRVIELTESSALVTYKVVAQREGQGEYVALMTSAYVKANGRWKLALHQQTPFG
ncbi:MAG: nuclear transport factor 2 family protein [Actinomycetota bacterium]